MSWILFLLAFSLGCVVVPAAKDDLKTLENLVYAKTGEPLDVNETYKNLLVLYHVYRHSEAPGSSAKAEEVREIIDVSHASSDKCNVDVVARINLLLRRYKENVNIEFFLKTYRDDQLRLCYEEGYIAANGRRKFFPSEERHIFSPHLAPLDKHWKIF